MTTLNPNCIHYGEIIIVGAFSYHPTFHALALELLDRKVIDATQIITHTFSLKQIAEAFQPAAATRGDRQP